MNAPHRSIARASLILVLLGTATAAALPAGSRVVLATTPGLSPLASHRPPTRTPVPPATNTPVPPATNTPVPPATNTPTNTVVPPTSTPPNTAVPPTSTPPNTAVPTATPTSTGSSDPVIMTAGDIACDTSHSEYNGGKGDGSACMQLATSNLLTSTVDGILPLGDDQYISATVSQFTQVYDPSWGRYKAKTYPASGNHEYLTSGAADYYSYFGAAAGDPQKGYYSYNLGSWHLIALNSECTQVGECKAGSPQEQWLSADLAAHPTMCTLAYWHRPLFTSAGVGGDASVQDLWVDLYNAHADLVLNGHAHNYERFAPQDPSGNADPTNGVTEIIVGTGGVGHDSIHTPLAANSVVQNANTYGVLKLTLHPASFDWQFLRETNSLNGTFTESGSQACR